MEQPFLIGLSAIVILGVAAQWLAWRLHFPSIIFLLLFGILAGPVFHLIDPDVMFGPVLMPMISVSVALILFEGALSLRWKDLLDVGPAVLGLVSVGAAVTWAGGTLAAVAFLDFSLPLALLIGAILTVTGPTVVIPLLRHVRPSRRVSRILKWEAIVIDPVGVVLSVLVFEYAAAGSRLSVETLVFMIKSLAAGAASGYLGAWILVKSLKRFWIPDHLHDAVTLLAVLTVFLGSNLIQMESGLYGVIVMGLFLANQRQVAVEHIVNFKENLGLLIISGLFILLGARLQVEDLRMLQLGHVLFVAALVLAVRPLTVWVSTWGIGLTGQEKRFMAFLAPRGIVAAAMASVFAYELSHRGVAGAEQLVPVVFFTIIATVIIYGLSAAPLARRLGLSRSNPQGCLFMSAGPFVRALAKVLRQYGIRCVLVDTNEDNAVAARQDGLEVYVGDILDEETRDEIDLDDIGRFLALTSNHEANSLAVLFYRDVFGRANVYQVGTKGRTAAGTALALRGRFLFGPNISPADLNRRIESGDVVTVKIFRDASASTPASPEPMRLCLIDEDKKVRIFSTDETIVPRPGQTVVYLEKAA